MLYLYEINKSMKPLIHLNYPINKDILINRGFKKAFRKLMNNLVQSKDLNKVKNINLNETIIS